MCVLIVIAIGIGGFAVYATQLINETPDISTIDISPKGFSTTILDKDGAEIENLASAGSNREYVTLDEIPEDLQHAFVAIEDSRFYEHNGIDTRGIIRAAFIGIGELVHGGSPSQGASTITQQLLKNNVFTTWTSENNLQDSLKRKIQEQYLAVQLEKVVSKDEILENYLNTINLGQNTLGVQAASERYFNKSVSDLNLSESAVIAGITQNPSRYNPISHPDNNAERRSKVLKNMLDQGYITQAEYELLTSWDTLLQASRDLKSRPVPTLTLKQLDQRKALLDETRRVLAGKATAKTFKSQAAKIQKFLK